MKGTPTMPPKKSDDTQTQPDAPDTVQPEAPAEEAPAATGEAAPTPPSATAQSVRARCVDCEPLDVDEPTAQRVLDAIGDRTIIGHAVEGNHLSLVTGPRGERFAVALS